MTIDSLTQYNGAGVVSCAPILENYPGHFRRVQSETSASINYYGEARRRSTSISVPKKGCASGIKNMLN